MTWPLSESTVAEHLITLLRVSTQGRFKNIRLLNKGMCKFVSHVMFLTDDYDDVFERSCKLNCWPCKKTGLIIYRGYKSYLKHFDHYFPKNSFTVYQEWGGSSSSFECDWGVLLFLQCWRESFLMVYILLYSTPFFERILFLVLN